MKRISVTKRNIITEKKSLLKTFLLIGISVILIPAIITILVLYVVIEIVISIAIKIIVFFVDMFYHLRRCFLR